MKSIKLIFFSVLLIAAIPVSAMATPSLGVATGSYAYTSANPPTDAYIQYFADNNLSPGTYEGFLIGPSGSTLTVFTSITGDNIYLCWENAIQTANSPTITGYTSSTINVPKIDGYNSDPYTGVNLGSVNSSWTTLPAADFSPGTFYALTLTLNYSGTLPQGYYFFAEVNDGASFSPKTSSATVPVPPGLLLLGTGMAGLIGIRRFRR